MSFVVLPGTLPDLSATALIFLVVKKKQIKSDTNCQVFRNTAVKYSNKNLMTHGISWKKIIDDIKVKE